MDIVLKNGEIVCIDGDARELRISCHIGKLWITQPGDPTDYLIGPGDFFAVSRKGRIAVTALDESSAHFSSPVELKRFQLAWDVQLA